MFIQTPTLRINGTLKKGNNPNKIILHHPVFHGTAVQLNEMEISNSADPMIMSGYNYYVRMDGSINQMRPTWAIGANCYGQNSQSISVCAEGDFMVDTMPKVQENSIIILCKYLMQQFSIKEVGPHKKYSSTDCPGKNYPVTEIINAINSTHSVVTSKYSPEELYTGMFSENWYLSKNPDVATAVKAKKFTSGLDHYLQYGKKENRSACPPLPLDFNEGAYLTHNPDVKKAVVAKGFSCGAEHYLTYGFQEKNRLYK